MAVEGRKERSLFLLFVFERTKQSGVERLHDRTTMGRGTAKMPSLITFGHPQVENDSQGFGERQYQRSEENWVLQRYP